MSQKSSVPQAISFVSRVLKRDMHAKLAVTAYVADTDDFAARPERAIARSGVLPKLIAHQPDEGR
jgi:hypothetical protein